MPTIGCKVVDRYSNAKRINVQGNKGYQYRALVADQSYTGNHMGHELGLAYFKAQS
jgi:hypothetical protein